MLFGHGDKPKGSLHVEIEEMRKCGEALRGRYGCYVLHLKASSEAAEILDGVT